MVPIKFIASVAQGDSMLYNNSIMQSYKGLKIEMMTETKSIGTQFNL